MSGARNGKQRRASMADRIDWDKGRRQNLVLRQGAERSEYTDVGAQIGKAKGMAKIRGPMLRACTGCGEYYDERAPEAHVCRPRPASRGRQPPKRAWCSRCGLELRRSDLHALMLEEHGILWYPEPTQPKKKARPQKVTSRAWVKCKFCGRVVAGKDLIEHNKALHHM